MNQALPRRMAALTGLAISVVIASWWLGSTRLALDDRADPSRAAADALMLTWLVRGIALAMLGPRSGALRGWRPASMEAFALVSPAWPVVVFAWHASTLPWAHAVLAELLLFAAGGVLALIGHRLRIATKRPDFADALAMTLGVALAATLWLMRTLWAPPAS
jgi:hypothetical protein